jgi:UDP-N-acetylmuramyl pentapeptide phosphotransferase/UDP-N-acetylglucosamine-1-phosphate transferase
MIFPTLHITLQILTFSIGIAVSLVLIPKIIKWVNKNNVLESPNWRSSHTAPTPSLGGISFSISIAICSLLFIRDSKALILMGSITSISILGIVDDLKNLKARHKFVAQFLIATLLYLSGFQITNLHDLFNINELPEIVGFLITITFMVGVTNAYNLIDGVDGLAGGLGLISSISFGILFSLQGKFDLSIISFALSGSLIGFLKYNFQPAKIFMGDTGSLVIGLSISALFIETWTLDNSQAITISLATFIIPCFDMFRLFFSRIIKRKSPFKADKNHYHHLLLKSGDSHKKVSLTVYLFAIILIILGLVLDHFYNLRSTLLMVFVCSISSYLYIEIRFYSLTKKEDKIIQNSILQIVGQNKLLNQKT